MIMEISFSFGGGDDTDILFLENSIMMSSESESFLIESFSCALGLKPKLLSLENDIRSFLFSIGDFGRFNDFWFWIFEEEMVVFFFLISFFFFLFLLSSLQNTNVNGDNINITKTTTKIIIYDSGESTPVFE